MPTYTQAVPAYLAFTRRPLMAMAGSVDLPAINLTKSISGHVYDASGAAVVGATVVLFRQVDNLACLTTTSTAGGNYSFPRRSDDTYSYYTIAYTVVSGSTQVHGTSDRGLVPV